MVVQSREREIDLRDLITLPVYLSLKNERKRKTKGTIKQVSKIFCTCVVLTSIFFQTRLRDSASWNTVPSIDLLFPRDRLIDGIVHPAEGWEKPVVRRKEKKRRYRGHGIFFVLNVATVFTEYSIKNCLPFRLPFLLS